MGPDPKGTAGGCLQGRLLSAAHQHPHPALHVHPLQLVDQFRSPVEPSVPLGTSANIRGPPG